MAYYLAIARGPPIPRRGRDATIRVRIHANRFREEYPTAAGSERETAPTSMAPPDFDNFNQDEGTFGWGDDEEGEDPTLDYGDYRGYTSAPHFYHQPFPLPDSPTYYGQYRLGGQGPDDPVPGGSGDVPPDPPQPSNEERLDAACRQSETNRREYNVLKAQMEAAQAKMASYDATWDFNQPPAPSKGKEPDRGRPLIPNYQRPLYNRDDRWSVPHPPPKWQAPDPYPAPVSTAPNEAPWLGVKPLMVKPPLPFEGKYDDVERFVGDCFTYFEVFASYFQVPSPPPTQDFWCNDEADPVNPRFRFPSWGEFTTLLAQNFHDPASEELHEKRMFDLCMGKGPAISYFQELEVEAKKANRQADTDARGLMVKAVRLGVPDSYTNAIANSGQHIPVTYNDWKRRICIMYEERQKKWVFDQTIGNRPAPKHTSGTTATSPQKTGGATSSTPAKQLSNSSAPTGGRDSLGRWTTHPGQGLPMSIDAQKLRNEGRCFRCKEKGHMSRDCLRKKEFRDIRSVQVTNEPVTGSKIEEVKEEKAAAT
ncbi:uncharacterized protein ARMOST_16728 [Armillaria ostoyae]|uniref:CCHC-type domain-containing protein n=1 Tax=Armillaria ostoyae TaxID=47428 RepID=A0A284RX07_ARMOS|nr:uncharacterized protein ARMOST_16728 [Armillaria ostoyae]